MGLKDLPEFEPITLHNPRARGLRSHLGHVSKPEIQKCSVNVITFTSQSNLTLMLKIFKFGIYLNYFSVLSSFYAISLSNPFLKKEVKDSMNKIYVSQEDAPCNAYKHCIGLRFIYEGAI